MSGHLGRLGASGGVIGVVAVDGMADNTKNGWNYPLTRVVFEQNGAAPVAVGSIR